MDPHWSPIMTAEIIPFRRSSRLPVAANGTTREAPLVDIHTSSGNVLAASVALSAACREMAASLALLIAHCESAGSLIAELSDGADTAADVAGAIDEAAVCLSGDVGGAICAVTKAARASATQG
jgi:hypothetical protein